MINRFTFLLVHFWLVDLKQCFAFSLVIYFLKLTIFGMFWQWQCLCLLCCIDQVFFAFGNVPLFYFWQCSVVLFCFISTDPQSATSPPLVASNQSSCQGADYSSNKIPPARSHSWKPSNDLYLTKEKSGSCTLVMVGHLTDQPSEKWGAIREWSRSQCFR